VPIYARADIRSVQPDYWPTDEWISTIPEMQQMASGPLIAMQSYIEENDLPLDSVLVVRNGYIVYEHYPRSYQADYVHILHSVTKSFTSALMGIAIDRGDVGSVDDLVLSYFSDRTIANLDEWKEALTIEHLLNMRAGFEWDEWTYSYSDPRNDLRQMIASGDCVQFMLDLPMAAQPGTTWVYNTGASHLLGAIIYEATGLTLLQYAQLYLFGSLGISDVFWTRDFQGLNYGGSELHLRPRDMAKFGFLFLNGGEWEGQQVVSANWVAQSQRSAVYLSSVTGYGYQWWKYLPTDTYEARGLHNQWIIIHPEYELVIIFTASDFDGEISVFDLVQSYIFQAIEDYSPPVLLAWTTPLLITVGIGLPVVLIGIFFFVRRKRS
jgi:CubicO group peptidase (beta-lactamase class C family)